MKIDLDELTLNALNGVESRIEKVTGVKPRSCTTLSQLLLQWACEQIPDSELKLIGPKTLSLAQRRKLLAAELRAFTGQVDDPAKLDKLMRTLQRLKQPGEKEPPEREQQPEAPLAS